MTKVNESPVARAFASRRKWHLLGDTPQSSVQLLESSDEGLKVFPVAGVTDVQVTGQAGRAEQAAGEGTDDDKPDPMAVQRLESSERVEGADHRWIPPHSAASRSSPGQPGGIGCCQSGTIRGAQTQELANLRAVDTPSGLTFELE